MRKRLKTDVKNLCQMKAVPLSPKPPEFGESEMWAVMMLCTTAASLTPQPGCKTGRGRRGMRIRVIRAISVEGTQRAREIRAMPVIHNRVGIIRRLAGYMQSWRHVEVSFVTTMCQERRRL